MSRVETGLRGEEQAVEFLTSQGYDILKRNYRSRFGEIDIIAYDREMRITAFVEVRTKTTELFGFAEESITSEKRNRLFKTALFYLGSNPTENYRFDLIAINLFTSNPITHYKNIIEA